MATDDRPTPDEIEDWDKEDLEEFNERTEQRLREATAEETTLDDDQEAALEALLEADDLDTEPVDLGTADDPLPVKRHLTTDIEDRLTAIQRNRGNIGAVREDMIEVLAWLIDDDTYGTEEFWIAYGKQRGSAELEAKVLLALEPYFNHIEEARNVEKFRDD